MEFSNKEVIDRLQEYFLTQDPKVVARSLAGMLVDMNRLESLENLPKKERDLLFVRIAENARQLRKFVKDGPDGDLKLNRMNSDEKMP